MASRQRESPVDASLDWLVGTVPRRRPSLRAAVLKRPQLLLAALLVLALICVSVALFVRASNEHPVRRAPVARALPRIDSPFAPTALRRLTPKDAVAWNAAAPSSTTPNPAAAAFVARLATASDYPRTLQCLTMAIYYEAGNEPDDGQRAVAQVVINRVRHIAYPHTVCGVVFQGAEHRNACQFTFACDGALSRTPSLPSWRRAERVAAAALGGYVFAPVGLATHYHADYVVPYWAARLDKVTTIGTHIFYRWAGIWGRRGAFTAVYAGGEPAVPFGGDAVPMSDPGRLADAPPALVVAADRPVLVPGPAGSDAGVAPTRYAGANAAGHAASVGLQDRWIVPRGASGPPTEPPRSDRQVLPNAERTAP